MADDKKEKVQKIYTLGSPQQRLAKLIDVKSITTFAFVGAFIASIFLDKTNPELSEITRTIVIFFFGSKYGENKKEVN